MADETTNIHESSEQEQQSQDWHAHYLRAAADLSNYKRRVEKEKESWSHAFRSDLLLDILNVVDDFDRAFASQQAAATDEVKEWLVGFDMIRKSLGKILARYDVTEIANVTTFDPELHEAIAQVAADGREPGAIVDVLQKGYMLKDRVLRPAKVCVAQ